MPGLESGPVAEIVGTENIGLVPDDEELLPEDSVDIEDVTLLGKEPIVEVAPIVDGVPVKFEVYGEEEVDNDVRELEEFRNRGMTEELAKVVGMIGIELPLPTIEGA